MTPPLGPVPAAPPDAPGFRRRLAAVLLFLAPLAYASLLLTVVVHEVLGHGGAAIAVGGELLEFQVGLDGSGWASTRAPGHRVLVLAAGIAADLLLAVPLLLVGASRRVGPLPRLAAVVFATLLLADALPYAFWGAAWGRGPSDTARIAAISGEPAVRWGMAVLAGALHLLAVVVTTRLLFRGIEDAAGPLTRPRALALAASISLGGAALWFLLDWGHLVPGSGRLPEASGAAIQVAAAFGVALRRTPAAAVAPPPRRAFVVALAAAWAFAAAAVILVAFWTSHGVRLD